MKAFISGVGWVTTLNMGCGRDHRRFELKAGKLPDITRQDAFDSPYPHFGRLDRYSRLGISAIAFALQDAGLDRWSRPRPIGITASTIHGCLTTDLDFYRTVMRGNGRHASPNLFAYTLSNTYLGEAAIRFGLTGASYVVNDPSRSELRCLRLTLAGLFGGQFDKVISGRCDLGECPPYSAAGCQAGGALFFVIEQTAENSSRIYGELATTSRGELFFNGTAVRDLASLAHSCIAGGSSGN